MQRLIYTLALVLSLTRIYGQVSIIAPPITPPFSMSQLYEMTVTNLGGEPVAGQLSTVLFEIGGQELLWLEATVAGLTPGATIQGQDLVWSPPSYGSSPAAQALRLTSQLPPGEYRYCYQFVERTSGQVLGEFCQEYVAVSAVDFELVAPFDNEEILNFYPLLVWDAYWNSISSPDGTYRLRVKRRRDGQSAVEAMATNPILFRTEFLPNNLLNYPVSAPVLEENQSYVWQVVAIAGNGEAVANSSIWTFRIGEREVSINSNGRSAGSFPLLSPHSKAVVYQNRGGKLRFAYDNWEGNDKLDYTIVGLGDLRERLSDLPEIALIPGLNTIELSIGQIGQFAIGRKYSLVVFDTRGTHILQVQLSE
ncbi:MAG: hypothetical protein AAFZ63_06655 [Bacteroidota bacterium]